MTESTDEEIYQAVMDSATARDNHDVMDDGEGHNDPPANPDHTSPSALLVERFVEMIDDSYAYKREAVLANFRHHVMISADLATYLLFHS